MGLDQYLFGKQDGHDVLIGYWRKANMIQGYFDNLAVERWLLEDGCSINTDTRLPLTIDDLSALYLTVAGVLGALGFDPTDPEQASDEALGIVYEPMDPDNPEGLARYSEEKSNLWKPTAEQVMSAMDILPTTPGFFFGSEEIDIWYIQDLYLTLEILDRAIDAYNEHDSVYYTAWW